MVSVNGTISAGKAATAIWTKYSDLCLGKLDRAADRLRVDYGMGLMRVVGGWGTGFRLTLIRRGRGRTLHTSVDERSYSPKHKE